MKTARLAPLFLLTGILVAQSGLTFETASIKPSPPNYPQSMIAPMPGGSLRIEGLIFKNILAWAYNLREFQISGGPSWISNAPWDILAKPDRSQSVDVAAANPDRPTDSELKSILERARERLKALLAERYQLVVHRETKDMPVYVLTVAKDGSKLQAAKDTDTGFRGLKMGRGQITGGGATMETLASFLSSTLGRPVEDSTGLKGHYNFKIEWTPDRPANPDSADPLGPSLFTALQEQIGLRLESQKRPAEMLVIDRVEKPSEN